MKIRFKYYTIIILLNVLSSKLYSQTLSQEYYLNAFTKLNVMLSDDAFANFKKAVFIAENAYLEGELDENSFNNNINIYTSICKKLSISGNIEYSETDKEKAFAQCATFSFMTDTIPIQVKDEILIHTPFSYNYDDFAGQKDWSNTFVSTLIQTQKGNCHSMPYLYKMIMDELGEECHLALAPNHIYIKARNKKAGWYNIELTCADFPTDAWLMASGYIHLDAIRNGIYMRALSDKEAVAMTLVDLAQGYQAKFGLKDGSFILQCCDTALKHFPNYINALLLKTEVLTDLYKQSSEPDQKEKLFAQMNDTATLIHELGYRKMPREMYAKWLGSLKDEDTEQRISSVVKRK